MTIEFTCKECRTELRLDKRDANQKVRCPHCGMIQTGPGWQPNSRSTNDGEQKTAYADQETAYLGNPQIVEQSNATSAAEEWLLKTPDEKIYGPVTRQTLDEWTEQGRVSPSCFLKRRGETEWKNADALVPQVAERRTLYHESPSISPSAPLRSSGTLRRRATRPNRGIWILVCALIGFFNLNEVFSLIAIIWGSLELKAISEGSVEKRQSAMIVWGIVLGVIAITLMSTGSLALIGR